MRSRGGADCAALPGAAPSAGVRAACGAGRGGLGDAPQACAAGPRGQQREEPRGDGPGPARRRGEVSGAVSWLRHARRCVAVGAVAPYRAGPRVLGSGRRAAPEQAARDRAKELSSSHSAAGAGPTPRLPGSQR